MENAGNCENNKRTALPDYRTSAHSRNSTFKYANHWYITVWTLTLIGCRCNPEFLREIWSLKRIIAMFREWQLRETLFIPNLQVHQGAEIINYEGHDWQDLRKRGNEGQCLWRQVESLPKPHSSRRHQNKYKTWLSTDLRDGGRKNVGLC